MMTDAVPAYYGWNSGYPGFQGLKLEPTPREVLFYEPGGSHGRENQARANEGGRSVHFPDGNATIARLLVRSLMPDAVPGTTQEDVVTARVDYGKLDRGGARVRIRLNSPVVHVAHKGDPASAREVEVTYVTGGQTRTVRGSHVVLACWNSISPHLCPEMPATQREALAYGIKAPIVYTNVFIRNWTAFARQRRNHHGAGGFHPTVQLAEPVTVGGYQCSRTPNEPIVLHLVRTPCAPGKPRKEQHRAGRAELLSMPFETFEREIRRELGRMLGGGGFDPARDILGITVNRWPHGYTYNYNTLRIRRVVAGRQRSAASSAAAVRSHFDRQYRCRRQPRTDTAIEMATCMRVESRATGMSRHARLIANTAVHRGLGYHTQPVLDHPRRPSCHAADLVGHRSAGAGPLRADAAVVWLHRFHVGLDVGLIMLPLTEFPVYAREPVYAFANPLAITFGFWGFLVWGFYFLTTFYFLVVEPRLRLFEIRR
jgi:hypothetical protein